MNSADREIALIVGEAIEIDSAAARDAYLSRVCGNDIGLRLRVDQLLEDYDAAGDFLERPAVSLTSIPPAMFEGPGTQIGPYTLLEQVGEGGMGVVYIVEQTSPIRRRAALKLIRPGMNTQQVLARFEAELQVLSLMHHPHISRILDAGTTESGRPYFVMELVRGIPITEFCDTHRYSVRQRLELFIQVCQAVQYAHQKGIIHRDLKPSNVLVELHDVTPVPKIIDFGIAKATHQQLNQNMVYTTFAQLMGTPLYMSPEQTRFSGLDVDTRSDVYSLGVMLYELLTGTTPFNQAELKRDGLEELWRMIREVEPPRPSRRVSTLPFERITIVSQCRQSDARRLPVTMQRELDWIVLQAIEKDRDQRYESASALAADLQRYLADEPVMACPPSLRYRLIKTLRRKKGMIATIAIVSVSLVLGSALAIWQALVANQQRNLAQLTATQVIAESRRAEEHARRADEKAQLADAQRLRAEAAEQEQRRQTERAENMLYASAIRLAYRHKQAGDDEQAQQLLDTCQPMPGGPDRRGIEWRFLQRQLRVAGEELLRLPGDISSVRIAPDGSQLAAATDGGLVHRYRLSDSLPMPAWKTGLNDVRRMEFSPDGKYLAVISYDAEAVVIETDSGRVCLRCPAPESPTKNPDVCFVDGRLLTSGNGGLISIWNLQKLTLERTWHTGNDLVLDLTTSRGAEGLFLLGHNEDGEPRNQAEHCIQLSDGRVARRMLLWFTPSTLAVSPDGRIFAVGNSTGDLLLWDQEREEFVARWKLAEKINEISFSPDGEQVAAAERTGVVHVWRWSAAVQSTATLSSDSYRHWQAHARPARSVVFAPDSHQLVTAGFDGRIVRWSGDQSNVRRVSTKSSGYGQMFVLASARIVAARSNEGELHLFDLKTGQFRSELTHLTSDGKIDQLAADDSGNWLAFSDERGTIRCVNLQTDDSLAILPESTTNEDAPHRLEFLPETRTLLAVDLRPVLRIRGWDVEHRRLLFDTQFDGIIPVRTALARRDGELFALTENRVIRVDPVSGVVRGEWSCDGGAVSVAAATSDGELLAIGRNDRTLTIVDAQTGQVRQSLLGHLGELSRLEFSPDGKTLLALDDRGDLRFWHTSSGSELLTWPSSTVITGFDLSADGRSFVAAHTGELELLDGNDGNSPPTVPASSE